MTLSEQNRNKILTDIPFQVLYPQIMGELSKTQLTTIQEILNDLLQQNAGNDDIDNDELIQAITTEVVMRFDEQTINDLISSARFTETIDLDQNAISVSEDIDGIVDSIRFFLPKPREIQRAFILASPLAICFLQWHKGSTFSPTIEGTFRGPANTMLVGQLDGTDVYSYLLNTNDSCELLVGFKGFDNLLVLKKILITNIKFVWVWRRT